jgi:uncharacterized membrane protein (DUF373 family)
MPEIKLDVLLRRVYVRCYNRTVELKVKYQRLFEQLTVFFGTAIRIVLNILVIIVSIALIVGVFKSGYDLFTHLNKPLETLLQKMLLDVVFIIALVEISITILGYLKDGYVHVRYIVDTILIIMLNEIVTLWVRHPQLYEMVGLAIIIATLAGVRVTTVIWSQSRIDRSQHD